MLGGGLQVGQPWCHQLPSSIRDERQRQPRLLCIGSADIADRARRALHLFHDTAVAIGCHPYWPGDTPTRTNAATPFRVDATKIVRENTGCS